jgi:hypothetical protein
LKFTANIKKKKKKTRSSAGHQKITTEALCTKNRMSTHDRKCYPDNDKDNAHYKVKTSGKGGYSKRRANSRRLSKLNARNY